MSLCCRILLTVVQYCLNILGYRAFSHKKWGWPWTLRAQSGYPLQGKIVYGGTFHGNEEEGKEKETLTVRETIPRTHHGFSYASREKHLLRGFSVYIYTFCPNPLQSHPVHDENMLRAARPVSK